MSDKNLAIAAGIGLASVAVVGGLLAYTFFKDKTEQKLKYDADIKIKEAETKLPPEYWEAKKAEAQANAEVEKAKIESDERLVKDQRDRLDAEAAATREFEKSAPPEYWEQKRIQEEEETKRQLNEQRYRLEKDISKEHSETLEKLAKMTERTIKSAVNSNGYFI